MFAIILKLIVTALRGKKNPKDTANTIVCLTTPGVFSNMVFRNMRQAD